MTPRVPLALLALAACGGAGDGTDDVTGPYSGTTRRYVVDAVTLPADTAAAMALGDDLDGDGAVDDQLGVITALLAVGHDLSVDGGDMIVTGALASTVELVADDPADDPTVALRYLGLGAPEPVPADDQGRIDVEALAHALSGGEGRRLLIRLPKAPKPNSKRQPKRTPLRPWKLCRSS